jgi:two-component system sensor histidine kinase YesM
MIRIKRLYENVKVQALHWFNPRLKTKILTILILYFSIVMASQIMYGLLNFQDVLESNKRRDMSTIEVYIKQVALNLKMDLDRVEETSALINSESYSYLEKQMVTSSIESSKRDLNTVIDLVFKTNKDIPGITIYTQNGGMLSYSNPYSKYYFFSGSTSMYLELLTDVKNKSRSLLMRRQYDNLGDNLLSVKFFQSKVNPEIYSIVVIEKNWGNMKQYFKDLGLLDRGAIVLITDEGSILFSFSNKLTEKNLAGLISDIEKNNMFNQMSGTFQVEEKSGESYVFYNKSVYSGCNLLYVVDSNYLSGYKSTTINFILYSSLLLILVNILVVILFKRSVYTPIVNVENAMREIVGGNTNIRIKNVNESNELSPLYTDLNSLTEKLKNLINSEYSSNIMKKQAEIDALQSQINPHFLYNTLESIRGQAIEEGASRSEKMVKALSDLFRYIISNKNSMVTLEEELKNIDNYLNIQQFRFNNKFKIIMEVDPNTLKCMIPKLIVQPLVENSIKHGLEKKVDKGNISIRTQFIDDMLVINVEDNGEGIDQEKLVYINNYIANGVNPKEIHKIRVGLGLININERIKMIYNTKFGLKVYSMKGVGTNVELIIPKSID